MRWRPGLEQQLEVGQRDRTKETETYLLNCLSDILQTAPVRDFAVADEVIPFDVEDATLIPHVECLQLRRSEILETNCTDN